MVIDVSSGPGDVVVVGGREDDGIGDIEISPGDGTSGRELSSAISFCEGSGLCDEEDFRPVIGAGDGDNDVMGVVSAKGGSQRLRSVDDIKTGIVVTQITAASEVFKANPPRSI